MLAHLGLDRRPVTHPDSPGGRHLVVIFGPPAVGKTTVGKALSELTGIPLFHNHMAIEPVLRVFDFDSPPFARLVSSFRRQMFEEVAGSDLPGLIYTVMWALEDERDRRFVEQVTELFRARGAETSYVELYAPLDERLRRNRTPQRLAEKPSKRDVEASDMRLRRSHERHRLNTEGGFFYPTRHLRIDNSALGPAEVAERIVGHFELPRV